MIKFNPSFKTDLNNWVSEEILFIKYLEHPQVDCVSLRGEVCYPNLIFESTDVNFGCILNDTEVIRYVTITNSSPLPVKFRWFFLVDDEEKHIRYQPHSTEHCPLLLTRTPTPWLLPHVVFASLAHHCRRNRETPIPIPGICEQDSQACCLHFEPCWFLSHRKMKSRKKASE